MNDTNLLLGSISNDLFRVVSLFCRGSSTSSIKFLHEAKKWSMQVDNQKIPQYIAKIITKINNNEIENLEIDAEDYLMYAILLQNYTLQNIKNQS